jgi:hypothetical protein
MPNNRWGAGIRQVLKRRACGKPVYAHGAYRLFLGGPATSPLGAAQVTS